MMVIDSGVEHLDFQVDHVALLLSFQIKVYPNSVANMSQMSKIEDKAGLGRGNGTGSNSVDLSGGPTRPKSLLTSTIPNAPSLSLPKGGGAVQGMGEKFQVNPSNGTGSQSVPIRVSSGRSGIQPQLSLNYDSASGNGEFGLGWHLTGWATITRKSSKGLPRYNDNGPDSDADVFLLSGTEDLVPVFKKNGDGKVIMGQSGPQIDETVSDGFIVRKYAPRIIQAFNLIERWTNLKDIEDVHWRVISLQNVTTIFGSSNDTRIYDTGSEPEGPLKIYSWLQAEVYDPQGNAMVFNYKREDSANVPIDHAHEGNRTQASRSSNLYLKEIRYGNATPNRDASSWKVFSAFQLPPEAWKLSVILDYGEHDIQNPNPEDSGTWICREDPFSRYQAGFEIRTYRLCQRVLMFHHFDELGSKDILVGSTDLTYTHNPTATYLQSVTRAGYSVVQGKPFRKSLPPTEFQYSTFPLDAELSLLTTQEVDHQSLENLPVGVDGANYQFIDLDGEGIPGILAAQDDCWYYKRNTSTVNYDPSGNKAIVQARFEEIEIIASHPFQSTATSNAHFGDADGAGKLDLISTSDGAWGYYERDRSENSGWMGFHSFPTFPNINMSDPNAKLIDLTGDGLADILILADQTYTWYSSMGSNGYGPGQVIAQSSNENNGPTCVFSDTEQTVYLADMSGDGLVDICRIKNGDCCYWPNLGYGMFGM